MDDRAPGFSLHFQGGRFEHHALPVEILAELKFLQRGLLELYRARYLQEHPDRQRMPRGARERFNLVLTSLKPGSVITILEPYSSSQLEFECFPHLLDGAVRDLMALAEEPDRRGPLVDPAEMGASIRGFGATLRKDEHIDLLLGDLKARYDQQSRQAILCTMKQPDIREMQAVFTVSGVEMSEGSCTLQSPLGQSVEIKLKEQWKSLALEMVKRFRPPQCYKALVGGLFEFEGDRLKSLVAESFEPLGARNLGWRIPFLRFENKESPAIVAALDRFEDIWSSYFEFTIDQHPALYALDEHGSLSAEWDTPRGEVSLCWEGEKMHLLSMRSDGTLLAENELHTHDAGAWREGARWILAHLQEGEN